MNSQGGSGDSSYEGPWTRENTRNAIIAGAIALVILGGLAWLCGAFG